MLNQVMKHNIKVFTDQVDLYKKDYFDKDEQYLTRRFFKGKKTLVLGCGAGRTLIPLHQMGYEVTGIDITPKMVEAAKEKVAGLPVEVLKMDACNLTFSGNSFDNVFFPFHGIDYIYPDIYKAILQARRVMKPDGVFVFNSHNRLNLKALPRFFAGPYANYYGLITYRATPLDFWKLKKYFAAVKMIPQIPIFHASIYFVCLGKTNSYE